MKSKTLRSLAVVASAALVMGAFVAPADAKKRKKAKTVKSVLYLHGNHLVGDGTETVNSFPELLPMKMDPIVPDGAVPKSNNYWGIAHDIECNGSFLFPTWQGAVQGTIVDEVGVTLHFLGPPSGATVRLWNDAMYGTCSEDFVQPIGKEVITIPAGQSEVKVTFKTGSVKVLSHLLLEVSQSPLGDPTHHGRILYDSPMALARVEFQCTPPAGQRTCTP